MQDAIWSIFLVYTKAASMEVLEEQGITAHTGTFGEEQFSSVQAITKTIITIAVRISARYIWLLRVQQSGPVK